MKKDTPLILLVDDSSTNNLLLQTTLKLCNFEVETANSGKEALKTLRKKDFCLVLLDVMMPGMTGYDVLIEMNKDKKLSAIPVIMVTARNKAEEEQKARELGAADYFEKPLHLDDVVARVKELVMQTV